MQIRFREGRVEQAEIGTHIIGSQHLANNAVSYAAQIKDGIIGYAELTTGLQGSLGVPGPDSIGTTELKEPAVGSENIYNGAVYGTKIANDAVGSQHIANDAIGSSAMVGAGIIRGYNITNNQIGSQQLADDSVINSKIGAQAVTLVEIKNNTIGSQQLADKAVIASKIAGSQITYTKIGVAAIGSSKLIKTGIIVADNLKDNIIGSQQLANAAVIRTKLAASAVGSTVIGAAQVTEPKFAQHFEAGRKGTVTPTGQYITFQAPFNASPTVVAIGQRVGLDAAGAAVQILVTPATGSFKIGKCDPGTCKAYYMAWGSRATI